jgi:three-Cys-motif partner protein
MKNIMDYSDYIVGTIYPNPCALIMENEFGGSWTETKIEILEKYASAYLTIMNKYAFHITYFDGFAGSGEIKIGNEDDFKVIEGAAQKIVDVSSPRSFDIYYFVEKDETKKQRLETFVKSKRPDNVFVVAKDCNVVLGLFASFLRKDKMRKALVFLDPYRRRKFIRYTIRRQWINAIYDSAYSSPSNRLINIQIIW